jgi:DNA modification methylase
MTTPFYTDDWLTLYGGDCREVLAGLPADSVDCVVTSPPYWGLRDYGTATWSGGDAECDHRVGRFEYETPVSDKQRSNNGSAGHQARTDCPKCGATRIDSQLGLERTPEEYVANMVAVFREVRRVLKPSGTCWLNLGDSYAGGGTMGRNDQGRRVSDGEMRDHWKSTPNMGTRPADPNLKPKDLVGIPWRVAFALQADGWYLRSDIIWSKPNPMPESVTDRPTKAHEYLFLLTKSARYYFDADAVRENPAEYERKGGTATWAEDSGHTNGRGSSSFHQMSASGRNIRSVWTIATRPYPGAHFAVFPPELPERCIKAGSSEKGVCAQCGAPWERVVERTAMVVKPTPKREAWQASDDHARTQVGGTMIQPPSSTTTGWRPTCHDHTEDECGALLAPAVILDPFGGSGTVGMVANRLSRRAILIDLNPEYLKQQMQRNAQTPLGLTEGDAA